MGTDASVLRLDPIVTVDAAFFWKAADEERFVAQQCGSCGDLRHPPRAGCPKCLSFEKTEQLLSGRGTVVSWVMPIHPPAVGFAEPPIVVLVALEEGLRFVSNVEGLAAREMRIGLPVEVGFAPTRGGRKVPVFHPAEVR
jgi:uncharacterized OB-fold protein